jgi:hypothetical protein
MLPALAACAAPPGSAAVEGRLFEAPAAKVEQAVLSLLRDRLVRRHEAGLIQTDWREAPAERSTAGTLLGSHDLERDRYTVRIISVDERTTRVEATVDVERRPVLGSGATRWERAFSDGSREIRFYGDLREALQ